VASHALPNRPRGREVRPLSSGRRCRRPRPGALVLASLVLQP
jgi:hypothetical protein